MKAAVRSLASGAEGFEKYPRILKKSFIFLNEYTTSVQAEHDPRGPEGPYRFEDRSVPVIVFKKWDGETLIQQLGFTPDVERSPNQLAQLIDRALKKNGPIAPPKALRPLLRSHGKAMEHLEKGRIAPAIRELQAVLKGAANRKKFEEPPAVAVEAAAKLEELAAEARKQLDEAKAEAATDPAAARKRYGRIRGDYGKLDGVSEAVKEALAALPKDQ